MHDTKCSNLCFWLMSRGKEILKFWPLSASAVMSTFTLCRCQVIGQQNGKRAERWLWNLRRFTIVAPRSAETQSTDSTLQLFIHTYIRINRPFHSEQNAMEAKNSDYTKQKEHFVVGTWLKFREVLGIIWSSGINLAIFFSKYSRFSLRFHVA